MTHEILLICGSYHPGSTNRALLDVVAELLRSTEGVFVTESIAIDSLPSLSADTLEPVPGRVGDLRDQVSESDAVVIAGPEYAGGVAGSLKNALDWCVGSPRGFYRKPVVIMSSGTSGGPNAIHQLARTLLWQGAYLIGELGVAGPRSKMNSSGEFVDRSTLESLEELTAKLVSSFSMDLQSRASLSNEVAKLLGIHDHPHASS